MVVGQPSAPPVTQDTPPVVWNRPCKRNWRPGSCGDAQLAPAARLPVLAAAEIYGALLVKVRENGYDNHTKRAYATTGEKRGALPGLVGRAWFGR